MSKQHQYQDNAEPVAEAGGDAGGGPEVAEGADANGEGSQPGPRPEEAPAQDASAGQPPQPGSEQVPAAPVGGLESPDPQETAHLASEGQAIESLGSAKPNLGPQMLLQGDLEANSPGEEQERDPQLQLASVASFGGAGQSSGQPGSGARASVAQPLPLQAQRDVIAVGGASASTPHSRVGQESSLEATGRLRYAQLHPINNAATKEDKRANRSTRGGQLHAGRPAAAAATAYHQLAKAQKLAVSAKRQTDIREKLHSNHIKMAESQQTYNPYHLSSYEAQYAVGTSQYRGIPIRDALAADGTILHGSEPTSGGSSPTQTLAEQRARSGTGVPAHPGRQKVALAYSSEIRKQARKKQEMEQKFKSSVISRPPGAREGTWQKQRVGGVASRRDQSQNGTVLHALGPSQMFGVQGERAQLQQAHFAAHVAREQMTEIAQMQEELEQNLKKLQHQKEHQVASGGARMPGPSWEYQAHKAVYRLDPAVTEGQHSAYRYAGYGSRPRKEGRGLVRGPAAASLASHESGLWRTSSQASSHQRRADAQRALQAYVIKEQLSPTGLAQEVALAKRHGNELAGEPGSPNNPLKVPTVYPSANKRDGPAAANDTLFGIEIANNTAAIRSAEMVPKGGPDYHKDSLRREQGFVGLAGANQRAPNMQEPRQPSVDRTALGGPERLSRKADEKSEQALDLAKPWATKSKRPSAPQTHVAQQKQSDNSRKRSSGPGSTKMQAVGNLHTRQMKANFSGERVELGRNANSREQAAGGQRQAIYSSYHFQRPPPGHEAAASMEQAKSATVGGGSAKVLAIVPSARDPKAEEAAQQESPAHVLVQGKSAHLMTAFDGKLKTEGQDARGDPVPQPVVADEARGSDPKSPSSPAAGPRDSLVSEPGVAGTQPRDAAEAGQEAGPQSNGSIQVPAAVDIEIFDKSQKLDQTMTPKQDVAIASAELSQAAEPADGAGGKDAAAPGHGREATNNQKNQGGATEEKQDRLHEAAPNVPADTTDEEAAAVLDSDATPQPKSPHRSPYAVAMGGAALLADALEAAGAGRRASDGNPRSVESKSGEKQIYTEEQEDLGAQVSPRTAKRKPGRARGLRHRPTDDSLAASELRTSSKDKGQAVEAGAGAPTEGHQDATQINQSPERQPNGAEVVPGTALVVTGARLQGKQGGGQGSPLSKEDAVKNAASTDLFYQKQLNAHLSTASGLTGPHANIRSQDQLGARRLPRRGAGFATKAGMTTGVSSQIHIHDHILSQGQGRGHHGVDSVWQGQARAGAMKQRGRMARARKLLASQGRSGAGRPQQQWGAGLAAVQTYDRTLHGGQEKMSSYFRGFEQGDEAYHVSQPDPTRPGASSQITFLLEAESYQNRPKRREVRKLLDAKDRKKVQFRPTPSRVGIKFKNKSEEERYLKIVTKILQMQQMSRPQAERTLLAIKRFLKEYLALIKYNQVASLQYRKQSDGEFEEVDSLMVTKFISIIKSMNDPDQGPVDVGQLPTSFVDPGPSGLLPSKYSASGPMVKEAKTRGAASTADVTRLGAYGQAEDGSSEVVQRDPHAVSVPRYRTSYDAGFRPKTQGAQRNQERTYAAGRSPDERRQDAAEYSASRKISVQNFIRKLFGYSRPRGEALSNAMVLENRSLSPSLQGELGAGREEDSSVLRLDEQRQWTNLSHGGVNKSAATNGARAEDDGSSLHSDDSQARWDRAQIFPKNKWNSSRDIDPATLYDGRRRDGRRPLVIPTALLHRNYQLDQYIDRHTKHGQHETLLPSVLTTTYYGLKQQNHTDKTILNRLQSKNMHRNQIRESQAVQSHSYPQEAINESTMQAVSQMSQLAPTAQLEQVSKSQPATALTVVRQAVGTNRNDSEDSAAPTESQKIYIMARHEPGAELAGMPASNQLHDSSMRPSNGVAASSTQHPTIEKRDRRRQWQDQSRAFTQPASAATAGEQLGLSMVGGGEDYTTQALKNQSVIRRNGLMLEHIMRQRGQQDAKNQVLADLHQELRNLEKREGTYSYKGSTMMPGQRSEAKPAEDKYLLVQVRRPAAE